MYTLYIYNDESRRLERYKLEAFMNIPYTSHGSMSASEFFSDTVSSVGWTSTEFLHKWNNLSKGTIHPQSVFRRIFEGGHITESMHYAGLAADIPNTPEDHPFPFSENRHVALAPAGFPDVSLGDIGLFVLVLQDALAALGFNEGELDGFFGKETLKALLRFRKTYSVEGGDFCDRKTWCALSFRAAGCGVTPTVKYVQNRKIIL